MRKGVKTLLYGLAAILVYKHLSGGAKLSGLGANYQTAAFSKWYNFTVIPYFRQHYPKAKPANVLSWSSNYWNKTYAAQYGPAYNSTGAVPASQTFNPGQQFGSGMTPDQACASVGGQYKDQSNQYGQSHHCWVGNANYGWSTDNPSNTQPPQFEMEI